MLDKIMDLLRNNASGVVANNPSIPNDKQDDVIRQGSHSIVETLKGALASGKLNDVLSYFKTGGAGNNVLVNEATDRYARDLQSSVGLGEREANDVAGKVIPSTMGQLATKTTDPSDHSFNIQEIFNQLSGGKTGGLNIQNLLNKFGVGNLDKDGDGDVDLQDLKSMFAGDAASGFLGAAKGMFK